MHSTAHLHGAL